MNINYGLKINNPKNNNSNIDTFDSVIKQSLKEKLAIEKSEKEKIILRKINLIKTEKFSKILAAGDVKEITVVNREYAEITLKKEALLKNPEPYYGKRLRPTGPKSLTNQEMAEVFSTKLIHTIK